MLNGRSALFAVVAALGMAIGGAASANEGVSAEMPRRPFVAQDLFRMIRATDPQSRPDGRAVAYVRMTGDIMTDRFQPSIWLVDTVTGAQSPLVTDEHGNVSPRWSPDGTRIAYVRLGAEAQLYVYWAALGRSAKVATLEQTPGDVAWSRDGQTLAFTMLVPDESKPLVVPLAHPEGAKWAEPLKVIDRVTYRMDGAGYLQPGHRHIFVVSAEGGQPRQLTFGRFNDNGPISFDADGQSVVFSANRNDDWERDSDESDLYRVRIADGALTRLTDRKGPDRHPVVSPAGRLIAYVGYDKRSRNYNNTQLYVMDGNGSNGRSLTPDLDRSVDEPQWAFDGRSIYVKYDDRGVGKIARVGLDGRIEVVAENLAGEMERPYSGTGGYSVGKGTIAFAQGGPDEASDLAVVRNGKTERLTWLNRDLFASRSLASIERLPVTSSYDKKPIDAWLVTSPGFSPNKRYPLILEIHGGPVASYGPTLSTDYQLYAAAGFIVAYSNPRGSSSYGAAFANQIELNWPGHDYDDLMSVVDAAVARGNVDPDRLFVTGGSGGGLLTAWIVGNSRRFRAAVAQRPVINFATELLTSDGYVSMIHSWFDKNPWEDPTGYWARSPLSLVGKVTTPTMLLVGEQDYRTPQSEAEQFYQALQLRAVPTSLVLVPGAGHSGPLRPSQSATRLAAIVGWFRRFGDL